MNYPLISEYIEAIKSPEDAFDKLQHLRPVLGSDGNPVMSSGNFAVVFKLTDGEKNYALKCFTKEQVGRERAYSQISEALSTVDSPYLCKVQYYEKELFVDSKGNSDSEFPVLLMDWVDGVTLDKYIRDNIGNRYALDFLAYHFAMMAQWLIEQPFAHGDLKPDNILMMPDGSIKLIDYDGMYVPAMRGERSRELGSPNFRHPLRKDTDFDSHIDDFALASILLSLKAISLDPSLLQTYGAPDRLLLSDVDYRDLGNSTALSEIINLTTYPRVGQLVGLLLSANSRLPLTRIIPKTEKLSVEEIASLRTDVTEEDLQDAITDDFGVKYSRDGKRLLKASISGDYIVRDGTQVVCDKAFASCSSLQDIIIPDSVAIIGDEAFSYCSSLQTVIIPDSVKIIGKEAFRGCSSLQIITIPDSVTSIGEYAFWCCKSLQCITIPDSVTGIKSGVFGLCTFLQSITIPDSVTSIGKRAFNVCTSLQSVTIPDTVTSIGDSAFYRCSSLQTVIIPDSVTSIGDGTFGGCESLKSIFIPHSVTSIGNGAFRDCDSLQNLTLPDSVTWIGDGAFKDCTSLQSIVIPDSVNDIGDGTFCGCSSLQSITIPDSVTSIGDYAFYGCESLQNIDISDSVTSIGDGAFRDCESLHNITIPDSVISIGREAFWGCSSLQSIIIPDSVTRLGVFAFSGCNVNIIMLSPHFICEGFCLFDKHRKELISVYNRDIVDCLIPDSVTNIGDNAFEGCKSLQSITISDSVTSIGLWAFSGCSSLHSITIPDSVTSIGWGAFEGCSSLQNIFIPRGSREYFEFMLSHSYQKYLIPKLKEIP